MQDKLPSLLRFRGRHFLTDLDFTREDLEDLLTLAVFLKRLWRKRPLTPFLPGQHLAMIFEAASTRTRVSFENGFAELGGNATYLRPGEIHLPGRESIADTAHTLSQYSSAIVIRSKANEVVNELATSSSVPVINAMDHDRHPCQSMSDAFTIYEQAGTLEGVSFAYIGDAAHPCNSLSTTLTKLGLNVRIANAPGYEIGPEVKRNAETFSRESGGSFLLTNDPLEAIEGADFIYTDCWWWTGQEAEVRGSHRRLQALPGQRRALEPRQARGEVHALPAGDARRGSDRRDRRRAALDHLLAGAEPPPLPKGPLVGAHRHRQDPGRRAAPRDRRLPASRRPSSPSAGLTGLG